ncbi:MAG: helix-turn-helix domain-containing protein [Alphaproteobacteria bacterium]|nr:helix-turn-helix domain-containing protein [Alphaproteobacteria bacterium]
MIPANLEVIREISVEAKEHKAMDVEKYRREFINRVVQARGKMKQRELAEILNVPLSTYKSYERRSLIPHERLIAFCHATGADLHWLLGSETAETRRPLMHYLWETDAEHRLASEHCADLNDFGVVYNHDQLVGLRRWEIPGVDAEALKMKDIMDRHEPLWNFTFRHTDDIGQCHEFQLSGRPVFDDTHKFTGYRGTGSVTRIETKASMAGHGLQNSGSG